MDHGWLVSAYSLPAEMPVAVLGLEFRYLDDDGTYQDGAA
jgi:hypothetical protein